MPKKNSNKHVAFGTDIAGKNMEHMGYLGNYRDLGQAAAEIQARLQARCGAAGQATWHGYCYYCYYGDHNTPGDDLSTMPIGIFSLLGCGFRYRFPGCC